MAQDWYDVYRRNGLGTLANYAANTILRDRQHPNPPRYRFGGSFLGGVGYEYGRKFIPKVASYIGNRIIPAAAAQGLYSYAKRQIFGGYQPRGPGRRGRLRYRRKKRFKRRY